MTTGRDPITLVHTSDVHIGPDSGPNRGRDAFCAVLDLVGRVGPNLFLIAGDLFDRNRVPDADLRFVEMSLEALALPVLLVSGNHDSLDAGSVYHRLVLPRNARLISDEEGEVVDFPDLDLEVWGRPLVDHHPGYRPLAAEWPARRRRWRIGLTHGHFDDNVPRNGEPYRSSTITPAEIAASGFDYLALGHWHVPTDVSHGDVKAHYPGSPDPYQARAAGHAAVVCLSEARGVEVELVRVAEREGQSP
jgi:DNA repair exonuclease SbcCD nuclease subunit